MRSCVKALNFCSMESKGELKDFSCNQLKYLEDELIAKLQSALKEAAVKAYVNFFSSLMHMPRI